MHPPQGSNPKSRPDAYSRSRLEMVARLREAGIRDERVLAAMGEIPRHEFITEALRGRSYGDHALPISGSQTISQPFIVARQTELLEVASTDRVLEIGAGSGYQTAVLSKVAGRVFAIERLPQLARDAASLLKSLRILNASVKCFDGTFGWSEFAPFRAILVAAGSPEIPAPLVNQLEVGGRLVLPVGTENEQRLVRVIRTAGGTRTEDHGKCQFVKLIGKYGWEK